MIDNQKVGQTIAALRQQKGMTQQALAAAMNVSHQAVSKWENGAALPDVQTLMTLSKLFGVTMEQLLSGEILSAQAEDSGRSFRDWFNGVVPPEAQQKAAEVAKNVALGAQAMGTSFVEGFKQANQPADDSADAVKEAEDAAQAAEHMEFADEDSTDAQEATDDAAQAGDEGTRNAGINMQRILDMAPFMSKEALDALVRQAAPDADWNAVLRLAPYVSRAALDELVSAAMNKPADRNIISKLAPFIGAEWLEKLIMNNLSVVDVELVRRLAPFMRREVVDRLAVMMATGQIPERGMNGGEAFAAALGSTFGEVGKAFGQMGKSIDETVRSAMQSVFGQPAAQPAKPVNADAMNKIARKALEEENWDWIEAHIGDIPDAEILTSIAIARVRMRQEDDELLLAILEGCVMPQDKVDLVTQTAIDADNTSAMQALARYASPDVVGSIARKAVENKDYETISAIVSYLSEDFQQSLLDQALADSNWPLIDVLTRQE